MCGHEQTLKWAQVRHEAEDGSDAWYQCERCDAKLTDEQRRQMVRRGRWVATFPHRRLRGYHLNGIASLFRHKKGYPSRLHQMVAEHISAKKKGREALRTWVNTFLAETWEEDGEKVEWEPLLARRENRRQSWRDVQRLVIRSLARDGEVVVRKVITRDGLRLQVIEADLLDLDYTETLSGGNEVRYGVEIDPQTQSVVAYHLLTRHPGDSLPITAQGGRTRVRIPAEEILHLYIEERAGQTRGMPWLVASMKGLRMLDGYAEAELVAARCASAKIGFFTKDTPDGWAGPEDDEGNLRMDAAPGTIEELPVGVKFQSWDPNHPNSAFGDFIKARLRGVASSLGLSYNTLSSDLEGVNYSSIRAGLLEEREVWKVLQRFLIEHFAEPIFEEWLRVELLRGGIPLPVGKMWKFNAPEFRGRRWAWVDPKKDIEAGILGIRAGLTSQRAVMAEAGADAFDVFTDLAADKTLAAEMGLEFPELAAGRAAPAPAPPEREED